jgi:N-acetylglucosamine kinase-like BadF-type ATPase
VAELSKVWQQAVIQKDEIAQIIQKQIVEKLLAMVEAVARSLSISDRPFDLVLAGSITQLPEVEPELRARLEEKFPKITIRIPSDTPAFGAIKLALKAATKNTATKAV